MAPPGAEHHSHLPELTGIEYAPTPSGAIHLPAPDTQGHGHAPLERVISGRRSCRDFSPPPAGLLHLYEIAQMCWAAQGVTAPEAPPDEFGHAGASRRAAPSGGRLYPLTLYVVVSRAVGGVEPSAYEYLPLAHALRRVPSENLGASDDTRGRDAAARAHARLCDATVPQVATALRQDWMADAAVVFVISGDAGAVAKHGRLYARFAETLVELEAGMVAAQLGLQATALTGRDARRGVSEESGAFRRRRGKRRRGTRDHGRRRRAEGFVQRTPRRRATGTRTRAVRRRKTARASRPRRDTGSGIACIQPFTSINTRLRGTRTLVPIMLRDSSLRRVSDAHPPRRR